MDSCLLISTCKNSYMLIIMIMLIITIIITILISISIIIIIALAISIIISISVIIIFTIIITVIFIFLSLQFPNISDIITLQKKNHYTCNMEFDYLLTDFHQIFKSGPSPGTPETLKYFFQRRMVPADSE